MQTAPITAGTPTPTPTPQPGAIGLTSATEQQDRFMRLLVAQMKNQDPLNPLDNAQMTSQIAQINTVGGIEKLNRTVESLLSAFTNLQAQSATQLAGRNVMVEGSSLKLADGAGAGGVELASAADAVSVDIVDAGGTLVQTLALGQSGAGVRSFSWDGKRADGQAAAAGDYRLRVSASAGGKPVAAGTLVTARVQSVTNGTAGVQVDLGSAGIHNYSAIKSFL